MANHIPEILLWLFIINLGIAFGAGLYETRIILPQWFTRNPESGFIVNTKAMNETDTGRKFWGFVTTMPLTLLTIANLLMAFRADAPVHDWWLAASVITFIERTGTFSFFIPIAIKLMRADTLPASKVSSLVLLWTRMNYIRNLLTIIAWLAALKALTLL